MRNLRAVEVYLSLLGKRGLGASRLRRLVGLLSNCGLKVEDAFLEDGFEAVQRAGLWQSKEGWTLEPKAVEVAEQLAREGVEMVASTEILGAAIDREYVPPFLFVKGNRNLLWSHAVGFCGSREASERGLEVAADIAEQVALQGFVCTSGGAKGVDMAAHTAALRAGGATVVVLAEGLLGYRMRTALREVWDPQRFLLVSEFHPADRWLAGRAMQRNRTICALSKALVLIEARLSSGTFAAGEVALEMGLPLFTAEYGATSEVNAGNRFLLGRGAHPLRASRATRRANLAEMLHIVQEPRSRGAQLSLLGSGQ